MLTGGRVTRAEMLGIGFDRGLVDAAGTLCMRDGESVGDHAKRVATSKDADVLAVAVAAVDDEIKSGGGQQDDTRAAYKSARRVLKRAADAAAKRRVGDTPSAREVAGKRPAAPTPHDAVMKLVSHTAGAQDAMMQLTYGDSLGWEAGEPLSAQDLELVVVNAHDVLQVLVAMVIDLTAQENEDTSRDKLTLFRAVSEGVSLTEGMETLAQTMARRLRHFHQLRDGEEPGTGRVH